MAPKPQENIPVVTGNVRDKNITNNNNGYINNAFENDKSTVELRNKDGNSSSPPDNGEKTISDFDDLLPLIGEFGRYQKILFLLMIPFAFFVAFVYFSQIFITIVPEGHWCNVPELNHLTREER